MHKQGKKGTFRTRAIELFCCFFFFLFLAISSTFECGRANVRKNFFTFVRRLDNPST